MKTATVVAPTDNINSNDVIGGRKTYNSVVLLGPNGEECGVLLIDDTDDDAVIVPNETFSLTTVELSDDDDDYDEEEDLEYLEFLEYLEESDGDDEEDAELNEGLAERRRILADARALKICSMVYLHPEKTTFNAWSLKEGTDPTVFGRNYFNRPSAPETEDDEFADERAEILEEAASLKKLAIDYLHPEVGVKAEDATLFGRNYFNRYSSPEVESWEEAEERAHLLVDAALLKQLAIAYLHPEIGVKAEDATLFGRNYFNRYSAPETEDKELMDERVTVLAEVAALKKLAVNYMHPEVGVMTSDASLFGRNYFNRPSAPETEDVEFANERVAVLAEAAALKKLAVDYMHPEIGVISTSGASFGRNYYNRYSAPETEDFEVAEERTRVLAEAAALEKLAIDYMHPEIAFVATVDGAVYGRNFFTRFSAPVPEDDILDDSGLKSLAVAIKNANLPGIKSVKTSSYDINADAPKRSESAVNLFGLGEEVF